MKKIIILLIGFGMLISCESNLDINRDPDLLTPDDLTFAVELPASITAVAGVQGANWALIGGIWAQMWSQSPGSSQYRVVDSYALGTTDAIAESGWRNTYDGLLDIRNIKRKALAAENWNYYLIATVLETYISHMLTDWYGDIPYSEANDPLIFQPNFDTGEAVYDNMITDLDDALSRNLTTSTGDAPGVDDLVFGGTMSNWVKFANTLKLKIFLRQTEARPSVAQAGITAMLNANVTFLDTDAGLGLIEQHKFIDAPNQSNPLFESDKRQLNTALNLRASTTMFSYLTENADPRKALFYTDDPDTPLNSVDQGDFNNPAGPNTFAVSILSPTTPVYFISHEESLFMQAEAMERYNSGTGAKAMYDAAVIENFNKWSLDGSAFVAATGAYEYPAGTFEQNLTAIITQKWVASYPGNGAEAFFEWHRTGIPETSSVPQTDAGYIPGQFAVSVNGVLGTGFPQRLLYPAGETSTNLNAPAIVPITTPIWWNQ
ncbi:SusD/RagB family nutrient-binding outer membrane lipoprotein [Flavivirga amylovorans]|uniref:SusD/RagB family nutrient-binding outer membrane lipoprotein n=1 Tax=Flavivirga amylovorans TaxID=870486 RepID=A0ABT8WWC7_9FLAO|nr:SusD/RagB family nutrient-binding outer membrane lipoprotein [Flavivirga amylovorans]MDO5985995.1 SusD/RagB family nutrient-binding outer membrane lipoprotein [Flavivirga amylovorans]